MYVESVRRLTHSTLIASGAPLTDRVRDCSRLPVGASSGRLIAKFIHRAITGRGQAEICRGTQFRTGLSAPPSGNHGLPSVRKRPHGFTHTAKFERQVVEVAYRREIALCCVFLICKHPRRRNHTTNAQAVSSSLFLSVLLDGRRRDSRIRPIGLPPSCEHCTLCVWPSAWW